MPPFSVLPWHPSSSIGADKSVREAGPRSLAGAECCGCGSRPLHLLPSGTGCGEWGASAEAKVRGARWERGQGAAPPSVAGADPRPSDPQSLWAADGQLRPSAPCFSHRLSPGGLEVLGGQEPSPLITGVISKMK